MPAQEFLGGVFDHALASALVVSFELRRGLACTPSNSGTNNATLRVLWVICIRWHPQQPKRACKVTPSQLSTRITIVVEPGVVHIIRRDILASVVNNEVDYKRPKS